MTGPSTIWVDQLLHRLTTGAELLLLIASALLCMAVLRLLKLGHGPHWKLALAGCACLLLSQFLGFVSSGVFSLAAPSLMPLPATLASALFSILELSYWLRPPGFLLIGIAILRHAFILRQGPRKATSAEA